MEIFNSPLLQKYAQTCPAGYVIMTEGDQADSLYILIKGSLDVIKGGKKIHEINAPGSFFGELSMLKPGPRAAHAVAMRRTELLVLDGNGLAQLQTAHPATAARLLRALCEIEVARLRWSSIELQRLSES